MRASSTSRSLLACLSLFVLAQGCAFANDAGSGESIVPLLREPAHRVSVYAPHTTRVLRIHPKEGTVVRAGDLLAELECGAQEMAQFRAEQQLQVARNARHMHDKLLSVAVITDLEHIRSQYSEKAAQARVVITRSQSERCNVRADFEGRVTLVAARKNEFVSAGQTLLELAVDESPRYYIELPPRIAMRLQNGGLLEVRDARGASAKGAVSYVSPVVDSMSQLVKVGVELVPGRKHSQLKDPLEARLKGLPDL